MNQQAEFTRTRNLFRIPAQACIAVLLAVTVMFLGASSTLGQMATPAEEFLGPFASWTQVQCSGADDTAMLQNALNSLGTPGHSPVLFIKPGTCRITSSLTLTADNVTVLGADPASTRVLWAGPSGASMFILSVAHSRFGRITWDHGGTGGLIYEGAWPNSGCCFPTDNRHEDELYQGMVAQPGSAAFLGGRYAGDAETTWIRDRFIGPAQVGIFLNNANVLDHWVWDSLFQNLQYGVTNATYSGNAAGGYAVNRSVFLGSTYADMAFGNTNFFSARWNYSKSSAQFIGGGPAGDSPAPWTIQGNTVLDTPDTSNIIDMGNPGPALLLDNVFRSNLAHIRVGNPYAGANVDGEITGLGNRFSSTTTYENGTATRLRSVDDASGTAVTDPGMPALPPTPQTQGRALFEPATFDSTGVQAAVNQAVTSTARAIVHLPYGNYDVTSTIEVPANATIQITGDGQGRTNLNATGAAAGALIHLAGPSKVTLRDISLHGNNQVQGISITSADQPNGVVHAEGLIGGQNSVGVLADGVSQTAIDLLDNQTSATTAADFRLRNGAMATVFNGAGCCSTGSVYDLQQNSTLIVQTMYFEDSNSVQFVAPNGSGTLVLDDGKLQGARGTATDLTTFSGLTTIQNESATDNGPVKGNRNLLSLGVIAGAGLQTDTLNPYAIWHPRTDTGGGGSAQAPEQSSGVTDEAAFLRQHEAPLRSARPKALGDNGAGVTDVHLYRVQGDTMSALLSVSGGASTVPAPAPPPSYTPTSTPTPVTPTATSTSTSTWTPTSTPLPATPTPTSAVVTATPTSPAGTTPAPTFSIATNNPSAAAGGTATIDSTVTSSTTHTATVEVQVKDGSNSVIFDQVWTYAFAAGETRVFAANWSVPAGQAAGTYTIVAGVWEPDYSILYAYTYGKVTVSPNSSSATNQPFVTGLSSHGGLRNNYSDLVGMQITVGASPLKVTSLGRYVQAGNSRTHTLSIYRASDGAPVASTTVNLATAPKDPAGYAYASLPAPVTLAAGSIYYIVSGESQQADTWEGTYNNFPTLTHTSVATIQGAIYRSGTTWISGGSAVNQSYVPVSFQYAGQ